MATAALPPVSPASPVLPELVAYVYDSFIGKDSLGEWLKPQFEAVCKCSLDLRPVGDAGQIALRLELDAARKKPTAHVVVGLDAPAWNLAHAHLRTDAWTPPAVLLNQKYRIAPGFHPFDYAPLTFIADHTELVRRKLGEPPKTLDELNLPKWKRQWVTEDPRNSTPGLAFLLLAEKTQGANLEKFLGLLRSQWLTLASGWSGAYGLFLKGEAPLVWSYATSQAYHSAKIPGQTRYQAVVLSDGAPVQIEGVAVVSATTEKNPQAKKLAEHFVTFLQSETVQKEVPLKNWMLPVRDGISLPESYKNLPALKEITLSSDSVSIKKALTAWSQAVETAR